MDFSAIQKYPPKAAAMFDAVIALLNEGNDLNRLKVSDITKKAGIGKGTAYEYFSSKEEMIAEALVYDTQKLFQNLYELQEKETDFEKKMWVILSWIANDFKESRAFGRLASVGSGNTEIDRMIIEKAAEAHQDGIDFVVFVDELLDTGIQQNFITETSVYARRAAITSQIACLMMFLASRERYPEFSVEEATKVAYQNIIKLLQV